MLGENSLINLDYWECSNGPWLILCGSMQMDLLSLEGVFRQLHASKTVVELHRESFVRPQAKIRLTLRSYCRDNRGSPLEGLVENGCQGFEWNCEHQSWEHVAELAAMLNSANTPSHQYLNTTEHDDIVIVLSKGEYPVK